MHIFGGSSRGWAVQVWRLDIHFRVFPFPTTSHRGLSSVPSGVWSVPESVPENVVECSTGSPRDRYMCMYILAPEDYFHIQVVRSHAPPALPPAPLSSLVPLRAMLRHSCYHFSNLLGGQRFWVQNPWQQQHFWGAERTKSLKK